MTVLRGDSQAGMTELLLDEVDRGTIVESVGTVEQMGAGQGQANGK